MKKDDARRAILRLWGKQPVNERTVLGIYSFCENLKKTNPELFKFNHLKGTDPCQIVKEWLTGYTLD